jgi:undecaprenyl-diphosphatase
VTYFQAILLGLLQGGVIGQVLVGSLVAGIAAYMSVRYLTRYFTTRTLTPFAVYCLVVGSALFAWFGLHG